MAEIDDRVGASLTAVTATFTSTAGEECAGVLAESRATTVKASRVPFALAAGVQTTDSPEAMVVVPAVTAVPPLVRVPVETASMRKERVSPVSTSASFAAVARVV
jgi:hypothetical protein